jgi:uncharacterized protein (DUF58 family)
MPAEVEAKPPRRKRRTASGLRRLRFTREGRTFVALTIGIGFAAINTGNNLLYLLLGWMMSSIIASGILSEQVLRRLKISRAAPPHLYAGRPFLMEVSVDNQKRRLPSFSLEVEDLEGHRPLDKRCFFLKVPAGKRQTTRYRHTFSRRGLHVLDGFRVSTRFPFALFKKSRDTRAASELLVYPALHPVQLPPAPTRQAGDDRAPRLGPQGDFFALRELRDGDDVRAVHWPSTARTGRVMVRELEEEAHRRATVMIDNALPALATAEQEAAFERAVSLAASLAHQYLERKFQVRLVARGGQELPWGQGAAQRHRILRALALLPAVSDELPFAAGADPRGQTILVTRQGGRPPRPPAGARIIEAA